ncbi:FHA domain-containing protein [Paraliomyxa miuraensis]|uniref:FHA domain-containing protein n=1 Tax=Paraliomyxa miuraensis TaxID=376150 RepID=UPI002259F29B|nr:FHA domain-containing protein [Paraliomyxa miuraensis]MCX4246356.1 FHA domain-containing protein [Paraliomyxa miuraensis]
MDGEVAGPMLVLLTGRGLGRTLRLAGRAVDIGRSVASDLVIEEPGVASRHARLEPGPRGWVLVDCSDGCGLRVNDAEVREHALESGDRIHLGEAVLIFSNPQDDLRAWLTTATSVEEHDASMSSGFLRQQWRDLEASMRPGDALWRFSSPPESWRRLGGRAGLCVVRAGAVVYTLVTEMN